MPKAEEFCSSELVAELNLNGELDAAEFATAVSSLEQSHNKRGLSHVERIDMASSAETVFIKYINVGGVVKIELNEELSQFFEFVI